MAPARVLGANSSRMYMCLTVVSRRQQSAHTQSIVHCLRHKVIEEVIAMRKLVACQAYAVD